MTYMCELIDHVDQPGMAPCDQPATVEVFYHGSKRHNRGEVCATFVCQRHFEHVRATERIVAWIDTPEGDTPVG